MVARAILALLLVVTTGSAHAEILAVTAGDDWSALAARAKPGDEIVLGEGIHRAVVLEGLAGTADAPIVIRPAKAGALVEIAPDREAIKLVDARHVRIERILVRSARRAGIVVEGTGPDASLDVTLTDILVQGVRGIAEEAGLVVRRTRGFAIARSRLESCTGAGIHLEAATDGSIERCQVIARADQPTAHGLLLGEGVRGVTVDGVVFGTEIASAVTIGVPPKPAIRAGDAAPADDGGSAPMKPGAPATPTAPKPTAPTTPAQTTPIPTAPGSAATAETAPLPASVEEVAISNCRAVRVGTLVTVGSARAVTVRNSTAQDPHDAVYRLVRVEAGRAGPGVRFTENLALWKPGGLRRIAVVEPGVDAHPFTLGVNLWWSRELPAAFPLLTEGGELGNPPFPGTVEAEQRIDLDPDLDDRGYPSNEAAKLFGASPT